MSNGGGPLPENSAIGSVVEAFLDRFRRGERPALTELVALHPDLADELRELIPALVEMEQLRDATGSFAGVNGTASSTRPEGIAPERLGDYRILMRIGGGGMGVVYEAEHESLKNRVALKVIHPRFRADAKYLKRFHLEARSAAALHHTNIVPVFDYGEQDGVCYYAMQFIAGQPLDRILADLRRLRSEGPQRNGPIAPPNGGEDHSGAAGSNTLRTIAEGLLTGRFGSPTAHGVGNDHTVVVDAGVGTTEVARDSTGRRGEGSAAERSSFPSGSLGGGSEGRYFREVARICAQVADALEYAHNRGVLHRDIKPPNLLLDALGNVWVTDFGLAKLEESDDLSQSRELVGTLRYIAPERFQGISERRGDIYGLGITLYELLTLQPAFDGTDQLRLIDQIVHDHPQPPRQIDPQVPRDLETIVLKALAKAPEDRFGSAREMADELRRYVAGHPIRSRPVWTAERFWRWCKRDPWLAGANVAAALLTTVLAIGGMTAAYVYRNQINALKEERTRTLAASVDAYIAQADAGRVSHRAGQRFNSLEAVRHASRLLDDLGDRRADSSRRETLRDLAIAALALPDLRVAKRCGVKVEDSAVLDIDPAFERFAACDLRGNCLLYRVADGVEVGRLPNLGPTSECSPLFDPKGRRLALLYWDGRLRLWDIDALSPRLIAEEPQGTIEVNCVAFQPNGAALVFGTRDGRLALLDTKSGRKRMLPRDSRRIDRVGFHPDGRNLVVATNTASAAVAEVHTLDDPRPTASLALDAHVVCVVFSPDGHRVALARDDSRISLWEPDRPGRKPLVLDGLNNVGLKLAFNHRGDLLASQGWEGMLRLWDPFSGRQLLHVQTDAIPRFSADDRYLGLGRVGESLEVFEVASGRALRTLPGDRSPQGLTQNLSFEPRGRVLAARTRKRVVLWDAEGRERLAELDELGWSSADFEADGTLLTFGPQGLIRWPLHREGEGGRLGPPRLVQPIPVNGSNPASSRDGTTLLLTRPHSFPLILLGESPARLISLSSHTDVRGGAVSPDGRWAATVSHGGEQSGVVIWEAKTGRRVTVLDAPKMSSLQFSPDGRWLATSLRGCKLWEVGTWRLARVLDVEGRSIAFSPVGATLAICTTNQVRLHDPETGRRLATLESAEQGPAQNPAFSRDGTLLAVADEQSHAILVWDLRLIRAELNALGLSWAEESPARSIADAAPSLPPAPIHVEVVGAGKDDLAGLRARFDALATLRRVRDFFAFRLNSAVEYHQRSHEWAKLGYWDAALIDAERALLARHDDAHWNATVGLYAYQNGIDQVAISTLRRALELGDTDRESVSTLAWALVNTTPALRDPRRALALAQGVVKAAPSHHASRTTVSLALSRLGRDAEAVAALQPVTALFPIDQVILAPCYHRLGQSQRARDALASVPNQRAAFQLLTPRQLRDLQALTAEAEAVLAHAPVAGSGGPH